MMIDPDGPLKRLFAMLCSVFLRKLVFIARCQQGALYHENNNSTSIYWPRAEILQPRWTPRRLSEEQKVDRVTLGQDMLQVMQELGPKQRKYLITSDENWIFWDDHHHGMWAENREEVSPDIKRMTCSKIRCYRHPSRTDFVSIEFLPQRQNYNSYFFTEIILPSIAENLWVAHPKLKATAACSHIDHTKSHNSRLSFQKIEEYGFIRVPQPPYSLDLAPCDFFLFGY
jgi:hypothetical protein